MKKTLALLLVFVLALGMSTTAFAAGPIDKTNPWNAATIESAVTAEINALTAKNNGNLAPNDEIIVDLFIDMFTNPPVASDGTTADSYVWEAGRKAHWGTYAVSSLNTTPVYKADISGSKFSIRSKIKKGSVAIDEVKIDYSSSKARLFVSMVEYFKSVDDIDFEVEVYPVVDGTSHASDTVLFSGTLDNDQEEIDADTYYAYMADGTVYEVKDYVREVEYELMDNGGVIVTGSAIKGQKYWGVALNSPTSAQADLMDKYDIAEVININTIGLDRVAKYVTLDIANPSDYVYNKDLKYLGKAGDELPYSPTYYLSATMLDVDGDDADEEPADIDPDDYERPSASGGDGYLDNVNDNPGTGK